MTPLKPFERPGITLPAKVGSVTWAQLYWPLRNNLMAITGRIEEHHWVNH
jgi:hypothetical protein